MRWDSWVALTSKKWMRIEGYRSGRAGVRESRPDGGVL